MADGHLLLGTSPSERNRTTCWKLSLLPCMLLRGQTFVRPDKASKSYCFLWSLYKAHSQFLKHVSRKKPVSELRLALDGVSECGQPQVQGGALSSHDGKPQFSFNESSMSFTYHFLYILWEKEGYLSLGSFFSSFRCLRDTTNTTHSMTYFQSVFKHYQYYFTRLPKTLAAFALCLVSFVSGWLGSGNTRRSVFRVALVEMEAGY